MKFMKLGTRPDSFYTEEAVRSVISDLPSDLTIQINNITYLLHKFPLLPKCGLLQKLFSESEESSNITLNLNDIPGGEEAFELCAKFCYGIAINLSAHNFVPAFCAAKFLRMTEAVETGNFVMKLEAFFSTCILEGWKDSVVTLKNTEDIYEWSENLGIVRRCLESIVDKILMPPAKVRSIPSMPFGTGPLQVTWSYTYTRPGYDRKRHQMVPKDWWTEDISSLGIDMFRCVVSAIKSTNRLPPQLIGESLHVYACCWLQDITEIRPAETSTSVEHSPDRKRLILETIVNLIPSDKGSVSIKFLLRLLSIANAFGVSPVTRAELLRLSGLQLDEASVNDLLIANQSNDDQSLYDLHLVKTVLESFLRQWKRQTRADERASLRTICTVGKLIDMYLQVVAKDVNVPVQKLASLAETVPGIARPEHDDLYKTINNYLKEHPDLSKADKKQLCRVLDCQKLSPEARAHAVRNELLPLRTVVQVLFFEQEKTTTTTTNRSRISSEQVKSKKEPNSFIRDDLSKLKLSSHEHSPRTKGNRASEPGTSGVRQKTGKLEEKLSPELSFKTREASRTEAEKGREITEEGSSHSKMNLHEKDLVRRISEKSYSKVKER